MSLQNLKKDLKKLASPEKVEIYQRFFKTGKGQYGEGDIFIGLTVPEQRSVAKKYKGLKLPDLSELLQSKIHEERVTGTLILNLKYGEVKKENNEIGMKKYVDFYLNNLKGINNWDLVDGSAPYVLGDWLLDKDKSILYEFAKSDNLWKKRISIIATFAFIKESQFKDALKISEILLKDSHDLIHKAVGWMLREIGKKDQKTLEDFLKKYYKNMPRTMLRYAIERF
ncbi:MAG: DNA alkylation repair protein, partial [Candidatus Nanoarchaeia archaeon]